MADDKAGFCLSVLGGFRLEATAARNIAVASRKTQGLLTVLALHGPAGIARERVATLFWGDAADDRARHSLRQALAALRRDADIVTSAGDMLMLDTTVCKVDVLEFRALVQGDAADLQRAMDLYAGPLLDGWPGRENGFDAWLSAERLRLERESVNAMLRLAGQLAASGDCVAAERALERLLELDPFHEEALRHLMGLLEASGRRAEAIERFHALRELMLRQLDVEPAPATRTIYDALRRAVSEAAGQGRPGQQVIAVLPPSNSAHTPEFDVLAASLAEDLAAHLARTPGLRVVAQPAVAAQWQINPGNVGLLVRTLGAHYLITGSLRQPEPGCVRVAIQVVDGVTLQYVWSRQENFAALVDLATWDDFVAGTSALIEQQLTLAGARAGGAHQPGRNAWEKMRQANSALWSAGWSEAAVQASVGLFREAIALDPDLALARAQKALVMALAARWGLLQGDAYLAEARSDAERALELEPTSSEVLGCAACAIADLGDPARAQPLLERAIEENPGNAQAWAALGATQLMQGQYEAGVASLRRGLRTSPTDYRRAVWLTALCGGLVRLERFDEALEAARGACRSDAKFYPAPLALASVLARLGNDAEAVRALAEARRIRPRVSPAEIRLWAGRALDRLTGAPDVATRSIAKPARN